MSLFGRSLFGQASSLLGGTSEWLPTLLIHAT